MQFIVIGHDGQDEDALARRLAVREEHLKLATEMHAKGNFLYAAATLNDGGQMTGSMIVCDFSSEEALNQWLKQEPYVTGKVWEKVEVKRCQVAGFCLK